MKHTRYGLLTALLLTALTVAGTIALAQDRTLTGAQQPADPQQAAFDAAIDSAIAGQYDKALEALTPLLASRQLGQSATEARDLMTAHMNRMRRARQQRLLEQAQAVTRVRDAVLAQKSRDELQKSERFKKLRAAAKAVVTAYNDIPRVENLSEPKEQDAVKEHADALAALDKLAKAAKDYQALVQGDKTLFGETANTLADNLMEINGRVLGAWKDMHPSAAEKRIAAQVKLADLQTDLALAAADLETLTVKRPWRVAMAQARLAKELAGDDHAYARQNWYTDLMAETVARADQAVKDAKWYDALSAYSGLEELAKGTDAKREAVFREKVKTARRHVRVLRLYGKEKDAAEPDEDTDEEPTTQPTGTQPAGTQRVETQPDSAPADNEVTWREMGVGVDANMVKIAIDQMSSYYVTPVDYRKVIRGALRAVLVLAETPQAADSFPSLKDDAKREDFVKIVTDQMNAAQGPDRVDQVQLLIALNRVLDASEKTVEIPVSVLAMEFTDGMLAELDKFSSMIWPFDVADFRKQTMGEFYGVGIQITKEPGEPLKVVSPLEDTPGYRAGIKAGDLILKVDGRITDDLTVDKLVRMITGPKGTKVVLTISRAGLLKPIDVPVVRAEIHIKTVRGWRRLPGGGWDFWVDKDAKIAYIRLTQFTQTTPKEMSDALSTLRSDGMESLILDVRFDPGGLLRVATDVADQFLSSGPIVSTQGRQIPRSTIAARTRGAFRTGRLAVLINEHSASASEILSGALKDHRRAILIGQRTFGKGSVQNVIPIRDKRAYLKLTTAYYYLPSGRLLHRRNGDTQWGVDPNIKVFLTPRQIRRWQDMVRKNDVLRKVDPQRLLDSLTRQYNADLQLSTAVLTLKLAALRGPTPPVTKDPAVVALLGTDKTP